MKKFSHITFARLAKSIWLIMIGLLSHTAFITVKAQQLDLVVQAGHTGSVSDVVFSPDRTTLASGGWDNSIKLWDAKTRQQIKTLNGHTGWVWALTFTSDGKTLASASADKTIKLWNVKTGREIRTLTGHTDFVQAVAFSPNSEKLFSGGRDNTIRLWDVESGKELKTFISHTDWVYAVAISPDGKTLASGGSDQIIKLWNLETEQEMDSLRGHERTVLSIIFSSDGKTLISGSSDQTIRFWNLESGKEVRQLKEHEGSVFSVRLSPDEKTLASGSGDNTVKLWNVETGKVSDTLEGHNQSVHSVAFSPDGKILASGSFDDTIKLWSVATGQSLESVIVHANNVESIALSPNGKMLAAGSDDNTIKLWDIKSGRQIRSLVGHTSWVASVAFSPDGKLLASVSADKTVRLWNPETGQPLKVLTGHRNSARVIAFLPDGKTLVSAGEGGEIIIWNRESDKPAKVLESLTGDVYSMAISPDGKLIAHTGNADNSIKILNRETGREFRSFSLGENDNRSHAVAFSIDGKILAAGNEDNMIRLWNVDSGNEVYALKGHTDEVYSLSFSPDKKTLASGSVDNTIKLWDIETGREIKSFAGHANWINSMDFSADGEILVSGSDDATIKVWQTREKEALATLISLDKNDWVVTNGEGRFDTNKSLDRIEGMHWAFSAESIKPLPLDVFMRQYYEPDLLPRLLKCGEEANCPKAFKAVPSIAEINPVQPQVAFKKITPSTKSVGAVDVVVEIKSVTEEFTVSVDDVIKKRQLSSGAFDLRLFRDGQLVGVSSPKEKLENFINNAPQLIAETRTSGKLIDTPEDQAWREANDIFNLKSGNVKFISPEKAEYIFRNVKLPQDGRREVEFTAYAFNSDKAKSATTEPFKFVIPKSPVKTLKKPRAFIVSIGVNSSENPAYNLRYAANDARQVQEIVGTRLKADTSKYSEVIQISLISDNEPGIRATENLARKAIIKGVFSLLSGNSKEIPLNILEQIPGKNKIKPVEPEDTLIIFYSGHGYADNSGIFYLLPFDIGADSKQAITERLSKMISSDELSLWMQDITASEMIMIIDACHSTLAVQGDDFKPGPMGSRGLGQLAYDKKMKILSATQADNVAFEIGCLKQGLLSFALLQEGIIFGKADSVNPKRQLTTNEWLSYAENRVPSLYDEVINGKCAEIINSKTDLHILDGRENMNVQTPKLFDFTKSRPDKFFINLL